MCDYNTFDSVRVVLLSKLIFLDLAGERICSTLEIELALVPDLLVVILLKLLL